MVTQHCECTHCHCVLYLRMVKMIFMLCKLYLGPKKEQNKTRRKAEERSLETYQYLLEYGKHWETGQLIYQNGESNDLRD